VIIAGCQQTETHHDEYAQLGQGRLDERRHRTDVRLLLANGWPSSFCEYLDVLPLLTDPGGHTEGAALPPDDPSPVPAAVSNFGGEPIPLPPPPRELAERFVNVSAWHDHDRGGHFPAAAEPELFARTLRDVFRPFR
jgi:hypothetical protein